jgi:hypothetical protein
MRRMMTDTDANPEGREEPSMRPWIVLNTTYDVEAWIDTYNRDLQRASGKSNVTGYGICFYLAHGGELYMHTTPEGDILLDVTTEAEWVLPVIAAATQVESPPSRIWHLPSDKLTELILGLSSLIASTRIVLGHDFKIRKY